MKKMYLIILLFISLLTLTGCGTQYAKDFEKNKVFIIKEEVNKEDVYNDILEAINNYNNQTMKTLTIKLEYLNHLMGFEGYYKEDRTEVNVEIESNIAANLSNVVQEKEEIYVKDGYVYCKVTEWVFGKREEEIKKTKREYKKTENLLMFLPLINEEKILKDEYQYGKDKSGNIIVQDLNGYFRMVIEDNEIVFIGYEYNKEVLICFLIENGKVQINNSNFDNYIEE